jgi:hypothetical protein
MIEKMFEGNWADLKVKIKLAYPIITDEDLILNDGEELLDLLARLQNKYLKTNEEIIKMIGDL